METKDFDPYASFVKDQEYKDFNRVPELKGGEPMRRQALAEYLERFGEHLDPKAAALWEKVTPVLESVNQFPRKLESETTIHKLQDFLASLCTLSIKRANCVFISYRSLDRPLANFLHSHLNAQRKTVWMDIWDPTLTTINAMPLQPPITSLLVAIVIEIALLHCSHLIVVHTRQTSSSVWVPYELGRVKQRHQFASNAAIWHRSTRTPGYMYLVNRFHRTAQWPDFKRWISVI